MSDDFVALLGVKGGPAIRPGSSMPTASLLRMDGVTVLIDAGLGASAGVVAQGVGLTALDAIVVTHLHSDHYLELGPLLHTAWTAGLKRCVPVYGPRGLGAYWEAFLASMAFDIELRQEDEGRPPLAELVEIQEIAGRTHRIGGLTMHSLLNVHPPIEGSYALRFESGGRSVVFSGDTAPMEAMAEFARGADLLVHEAMLPEAMEALVRRVGNGDDRLLRHILRSHTPAAEAARIGNAAQVRRLALHHLLPADDPAYGPAAWRAAAAGFEGELLVGQDGMRIVLESAGEGGA
jgi:ribonuclease BN (tRNA processing enzyme)